MLSVSVHCMQRRATEYIDVLMEVYKKHRRCVLLHLGNDPLFLTEFDKVFTNFIN